MTNLTAAPAACNHEWTARRLLADQHHHRAALAALNAGQKYYQAGVTSRAVVIEAIEILRDRNNRRSCRGIADQARRGEPGRILALQQQRLREREEARIQRLRRRVQGGKLGAAATKAALADGTLARLGLGRPTDESDAIVRLIVRCVGTIGDQAERDLAELRSGQSFSGKRGRHHKLEGSEVDSVQVGAGWREILITMCDFCSFGSNGGDGYQSRGGRSYRCYLVVRDTTTGEAHILRVPPKFGNPTTQFYAGFAVRPRYRAVEPCPNCTIAVERPDGQSSYWLCAECRAKRDAAEKAAKERAKQLAARARVRAAVAWTFGLEARQYSPQRSA